MVKNLLHAIAKNPTIWNLARKVLHAGMYSIKNNIEKEIGDTRNKKIVDLACGTGENSVLAQGEYVGVDIDANYIQHAKKSYSTDKKKFLNKNAFATELPDKYFDYALILDCFHHLKDDEVNKILKEAKRITKDKIITMDAIPLKYNFVGKWLYNMDQGEYFRNREKQLKLVNFNLKIEKEKIFRSGMYIFLLFTCCSD